MSNSGINFKVYCVNGENSEVKRFFVDTDAVTSFVFMKEKLKSVFPTLRDGDFKITWKDAEGDHISITNDDDFITALTEMTDNPKVLYASADTRNFSEDIPKQFYVMCDVCQKGISGYRYKCIECPDYDLCATCELNGNHSEHMVLRLPSSTTPISKADRKMMYVAARALKKSAFTVAREAHRCARDSFKGGDREKSSRQEGQGTSGQSNATYGCPFAASDVGDLLAQNIPLIEMFTKAASNPSNEKEGTPNPLSDLVRSVAEAFTGLVNPDLLASHASAQSANTTSEATPAQSTSEHKEKQSAPAQTATEKTPLSAQNVQAPTQPSAPPTDSATNTNNQEMEWTIVNDSEDSSSQASATSQTPTSQPPPLPQDPRLMRGLAQLYEMGFSNENQFLNYMLKRHNYNVGDVVKAILQLQ